ncbi:hypothetical protein MPTK1_2g25600 [Marchantia polymorpha subsp. ruderalis]
MAILMGFYWILAPFYHLGSTPKRWMGFRFGRLVFNTMRYKCAGREESATPSAWGLRQRGISSSTIGPNIGLIHLPRSERKLFGRGVLLSES